MFEFTVVIPVYKVEKYIAACLDSVLAQTLKDFEIIAVDDCGGDNSIKIVEEYAKKDSRIRIIYQETNQGVAAARNIALDNAKGKYLFCLDSDDWIAPNTLQILKETFIKNGTESIWFDGLRYFENTKKFAETPIYNIRGGYIDLYPEHIASYPDMCGMKAYKTESIRKINLHWPLGIKFDEDGEFYFKYYSYYPRVYAINDCLYFYRIRSGSVVTTFMSGKGSPEDLYKVIQHLKEFYKERGLYDRYKITLLKLMQNRVKMCKEACMNKQNKALTKAFLESMNFPEEFERYNSDKTPLVSIVVPFYNVEKYIAQCLDSIIGQTYKNIEIICVDDCGQDNTAQIVEEYAKKDSRIRVIKHEKNRGLGGARNTGLREATGEYMLFIDSDDWIEKDTVSAVVEKMNTTGVNSVWFKAQFWLEDLQKTAPMSFCTYFMNMRGGYFTINEHNIANFPLITWNKSYRREFLINNNIGWRENIIYEDVEFYYKMFTLSPDIYILDKFCYYYRQRSDSIMGASMNDANKAKTAYFVVAEVYKYLQQQGIFDKYKKSYLKYANETLNLFKGNEKVDKQLKADKLKFLNDIEFPEQYENLC